MIAPAGTLPDGRSVEGVTLRDGTLTARVLTLGAIVQDLRLDGLDHPLVLGCPDVADYLGQGRFIGAIVGRVANRIGDACFRLDGTRYRTDRNFRDRHTLHGGSDGTDVQLWQVAAVAPDRVTMCLVLPDGHMGFPGTLRITAVIALSDSALCVDLSAVTDQATPCNLTHHGYFDLDGQGDIRRHWLSIAAPDYLPVDRDLIPTGRIEPVDGTPFDFRQPRAIGSDGFDHNFCLSRAPQPIRPVARVIGRNGLSMEVLTTAPGLQFYDGVQLDDVPGLDGGVYGPYAGLALEAQHWPDAPNQPEFPDIILRPGAEFRAITRYRFLHGK